MNLLKSIFRILGFTTLTLAAGFIVGFLALNGYNLYKRIDKANKEAQAFAEAQKNVILPTSAAKIAPASPSPAAQSIQANVEYTQFTRVPGAKQSEYPTLVLSKKNTLVFRDVVTSQSVAEAQMKAIKLSKELKDNEPLFLVLDTPGGSIGAGLAFIDTLKGLKNKVHTVTLFAASMGFHFAQALDDRLITPSGLLMSHRASIGGLEGEVPGEAVVRLNYILKMVNDMDKSVSKRIGLSFDDYRKLIADEYYVQGSNAVSQQMADKVMLIRCGDDLTGTVDQVVNSFFGDVTLTWSECPLITYPIAVKFSALRFSGNISNSELDEFIRLMIYDKRKFTNKYIITNDYKKFVAE